MLNITSGKVVRAQKITIYGAEGIGKTTLAAAFPDPLFIDTEGGTSHMDVRRIETPANWDSLVAVVNEVADNPKICGTLVLDTADWAEQLAVDSICAKYKKAGIEDFGYGKGYTYLGEEFSRLLAAFDRVIRSGIHVVITAHAKMRKFEQPDEMGAYDRWEMKLSKQVAPLLKEWCDMLLFCNYQTYVIHGDNPMEKSKVQGGKRVMIPVISLAGMPKIVMGCKIAYLWTIRQLLISSGHLLPSGTHPPSAPWWKLCAQI